MINGGADNVVIRILCAKSTDRFAIWKMRPADIFTTILATSSTYTVI